MNYSIRKPKIQQLDFKKWIGGNKVLNSFCRLWIFKSYGKLKFDLAHGSQTTGELSGYVNATVFYLSIIYYFYYFFILIF